MKQERPTNFDEDIHSVDYLDAYRRVRLDASGLISEAGRAIQSLNGVWHFSADPYDSFLRAKWWAEKKADAHGNPWPPDYDWNAWVEVHVPSCWNMTAPELFHYEGTGIYTRTFSYRPHAPAASDPFSIGSAEAATAPARTTEPAVERVFLMVGAASYEAFVFLNQRCLGYHRGGSTPFCVELSGLAIGENRLTIAVSNRRSPSLVPTDNTDWFNYGGLYRSVALLRVPRVFIKRWDAALVPGSNAGRIRVNVTLDDGSSDPAAPTVKRTSVTVAIPELGVEHSFRMDGLTATFDIDAQPKLWSPRSPKLYEVRVAIGGEAMSGDAVSDRVGFREMGVDGAHVLLNGEPLYLKGISCHEDSVANGKALRREEIEAMFDDLAALGCNFVRLAHYPHSAETARIADERGFLVWEEIPVYWAIAFDNDSTYDDAANQLTELIMRDRNRASVALWSVGNENPDTDDRLRFMRRLAEHARTVDSSRLVTAACLWNRTEKRIADRLAEHLDVIGINEYFGWYEGNFDDLRVLFTASAPGKPVIVSEFGAGAAAGHFGTIDELFTENKQRDVYEHQLAVIGAAPYVCGMTPWILYDFRSPRRLNGFQRGFNRKGLIEADRKRRKLAFFTLKAFYEHR